MPTRIFGILLLFVTLWNFQWIINSLNYQAPEISGLFILATILSSVYTFVCVINNWHFKVTEMHQVAVGYEPKVAVLIPTYGEPVQMVINTLNSVLNQDWPLNKLVIAIGDDANSLALKKMIEDLTKKTSADIIYHNPHPKDSHWRLGEAKAGNLNSLLAIILKKYPEIAFIETRDADDLVGDRLFLRLTLAEFLKDPKVSFVQTIKECLTSPKDPFSNNESVFYRSTMVTRSSTNALFPCGSGLVWRLSDLKKIGAFPTWNLVEDLQSGFEVLLVGGKGIYLPIVGALAQAAPEDIPNFYKQRGTWALDTLRLFFWKNPLFARNLNLWQRLQFFDIEYSYILSFAMIIYVVVLAANLYFNIYPILTSNSTFAVHMILLTVTLELFNIFKSRGISYKYLWRARQTWLGLAPIFIMATFKALKFGPNRKPTYKVTRKTNQFGWYWQETIVQYLIVIILSLGVIYNITSGISNLMAAGSIFWALFFIYGFSRIIRNSWFKAICFPLTLRSNLWNNGRSLQITTLTNVAPITT